MWLITCWGLRTWNFSVGTCYQPNVGDQKQYISCVIDNLLGTENLEFLGGDMFEAIPSADAILLKYYSVSIILTIIDIAIVEQKEGKETILKTQLCIDVMMMALFNTGKERSVEEWKKLSLEAGFTDYKITPILGLRSIIELYP
ncbi:hypothetical protein ACOSQ4_016224 [Xanthoceras sorbifolium]